VAKKPLAWPPSPPQIEHVLVAPSVTPGPEMRKCTLRISQYDYERLGILAVKLGKDAAAVIGSGRQALHRHDRGLWPVLPLPGRGKARLNG